MKKVFIGVDECTAGMQLAENIFNEYGAIVVAENTVLDNFIIQKIRNLGLVKVKIVDFNDDMVVVSGSELFRAQYNENVNAVKSILHDISTGREISQEKVAKATDSIVTRINENREIVSCINQMRDADEYTYAHSINVSLLCMLIGKWLKYDYYQIKSLVSAGLLHDLGKGKIDPEILSKPGPLDKEEFEEIKKHTVYGFKLAETLPGLNDDILKGILMHHEREDGSGYPFGLKGEQIHEFAKIVAVADIYDAMTSNRSYRSMECPFDVLERIERNSFGTLDHKVVSVFLKNIASYYMGDFVKLSTGDIGEIVYINPFNVSKPIVKVDEVFIDLANDKNIKVVELI